MAPELTELSTGNPTGNKIPLIKLPIPERNRKKRKKVKMIREIQEKKERFSVGINQKIKYKIS